MTTGMQIAEAFVAIRPKKADNFEQEAEQQITNPLRKVAAGAASAFAAVKVGGFLRDAVDEAREAARVTRLTEQVIKSTGGAAGITADQVGALASKLSKVAAVDDELIQAGENVLLTFTNVRNEVGKGNAVFDRATTAALDMSTALGTDMQGAVIQLGKALNDPITGITALTRVGVTFTEQQKEQIKALVESGDALSAQKIILQEVEREFGGAAKAAADPAAKLDIAIGNLKESIGAGLLPVLDSVSGPLTTAAEGFAKLPVPVQNATVFLGGLVAVTGPLLTVASNVKKVKDAFIDLPGKIYDASASLDKLTLSGLGPYGIALGAAGAALGLFIQDQQRAKALQREFQTALAETGDAAQDAAKKIIISKTATEQFDKAFEHSGVTLDQAVKAITRGHDATVELARAMAAAGFNDQAGQLVALERAYSAAAGQTERTHKAEKLLGVETPKTTEKVDDQRKALEEEQDAIQKVADGLRDMLDATLDLFNANLSYEDSVEGVRDALNEYRDKALEMLATNGKNREINEDYSESARDAARAALEQAAAAVRVAEDQAKAHGATIDAKEAARIQREELEKVAATLGPNDPLRKRLAEYIFLLGQVPTTVSTNIDLQILGAEGAARGAAALFGGLAIPGRASGGPVLAGQPYVVGEKRAELFVPETDGTIVPSLAGGGLTLHVHTRDTPRQVQAAVVQGLRDAEHLLAG